MKNIFIITFVLWLTAVLYPQQLHDLEQRYQSIQVQISKEYRILDSLNNILAEKSRRIADEKNKKDADNSLIIDLMSSSASLSNSIDNHQSKVKELEKRDTQLTGELTTRYNQVIDSLKSAPGKHNEEILLYTEKRLLIVPGIRNLSYKPEKFLQLDPSRITSAKEKSAYTEYLKNAIKEVDIIIAGVTEKNTQIDDIISLQKKTRKFLREVEMEGRPDTRKASSGQEKLASDIIGRGGNEELIVSGPGTSNDAFNSQVYAYNLLLNQLAYSSNMTGEIKWDITLKQDKYYNLTQYRELLKELKKNLIDYKSLLSNKLNLLM